MGLRVGRRWRGVGLLIAIGMAVAAHAQTTRPATTRPATTQPAGANPAAPGFDAEGSDARAIEIADAVMEAMGGRAAWDGTRYIRWNFFGARRHVWDKQTGRVRIEGTGPRTGKPYVILMNVVTETGRAWQDGQEVTVPADLQTLIDAGQSAWINDGYWLLMPYKLKDSGVTLTYVGEGELEDQRPADILQLTFSGVGHTPQNKYHVWVARESGLVEQWAFFAEASQDEPKFVTPWHGWKQYGRIKLCGDRGEIRGHPAQLTEIAVYGELPDSVFESSDAVEWEAAGMGDG